MLFIASLILLILYTTILLQNKDLRWIGWVLAGFYFGFIVLFGDVLRAVFHLQNDSHIFFLFISLIYAALPILLGEIVAWIFRKKILSNDL